MAEVEGWQPPAPLCLEDFPAIRKTLSNKRAMSALPAVLIPHGIFLSAINSGFLFIPAGLALASIALFAYKSGVMSEINTKLSGVDKACKIAGVDYIVAREYYSADSEAVRITAEEYLLLNKLYVQRSQISTAGFDKWLRYGPQACMEFKVRADANKTCLDLLAINNGVTYADGLLAKLANMK